MEELPELCLQDYIRPMKELGTFSSAF